MTGDSLQLVEGGRRRLYVSLWIIMRLSLSSNASYLASMQVDIGNGMPPPSSQKKQVSNTDFMNVEANIPPKQPFTFTEEKENLPAKKVKNSTQQVLILLFIVSILKTCRVPQTRLRRFQLFLLLWEVLHFQMKNTCNSWVRKRMMCNRGNQKCLQVTSLCPVSLSLSLCLSVSPSLILSFSQSVSMSVSMSVCVCLSLCLSPSLVTACHLLLIIC